MVETSVTVTPRGFGLSLALANLGLFTALLTPALVTLAVRVGQVAPQDKELALGLVAGTGALVALIANPLFGRLSDRTRSRFGRRRPWLIGGVLGGAAGLAIIALVPSIPAILAGWCLAQVSFNATLSALTATIPDQVPPAERGRISGAMGFSQLVAVPVGASAAAIFISPTAQFLVPALIALLLVGLFAATLPDQPAPPGLPPLSLREFFGSFWTNPRRHPDFGWAWLTRFLVILGIFAPTSYQAFFLVDRIGVPQGQVVGTVALLTLLGYGLGALTAVFGGWLSDWSGRRKPFVIGAAVILTAALLTFAFARTLSTVFLATVLSGIGTGAFFAVDLALITQVLPREASAAKDLGVFNIANALPQSFGPAFAPLLLALGGGRNYTALYLFAAVAAIAGAVLVTKIKAVR